MFVRPILVFVGTTKLRVAKKNAIENNMSDRKNNNFTLERKQKIEGKFFLATI